LKKAIHIDDQWIIPENTPTWLELLSLKWATQPTEKPKHYEERTRAPVEKEAVEEEEEAALAPAEEDVIPPVQLIGRRRRRQPVQAAAPQPEAPAGRLRPRAPAAAANDVSSE
jgi:hypothetical protein